MGWRRKPVAPRTYTDRQLTDCYLNIKSCVRGKERNTHHRLPRTRGGTDSRENLIELNAYLHTSVWHAKLFDNKIAKEVAAQMTVWWTKGYIFEGYGAGRIVNNTLAPGTIWEHFWKIRNVSLHMSATQMEGWDELFGKDTPPEVVLRIINDFFVHSMSPIEVVQGKSSSWWKRR